MIFSVVIITNGLGDNLEFVLPYWCKEFTYGIDLFLCGPQKNLINLVPQKAIIDYDEIINKEKNEMKFFSINQKKFFATQNVNTEYIFLVHDRLFPSEDFKKTVEKRLTRSEPDFGSCDIVNISGEISVTELRLKKNILNLSLTDALFIESRLVCNKNNKLSSDKIAINGGAFFIKTTLSKLLTRPMKWSQMEDDILSFDLMNYNGIWIEDTNLITKDLKGNINKQYGFSLKVKYLIYYLVCLILKYTVKLTRNKYKIYTISENISDFNLLNQNFILIDPLHRMYDTNLFKSTLEKVMTRMNVLSNGYLPIKILKTKLGWKFYIRNIK